MRRCAAVQRRPSARDRACDLGQQHCVDDSGAASCSTSASPKPRFQHPRIVLDANATSITATGQFVGSLPWASPEQLASGGEQRPDARSDVYSLGVLLYQMLTGEFPYRSAVKRWPPRWRRSPAQRAARRDAHRHRPDLETIVLKCLSKRPVRRYQTAGELRQDLQSWSKGEPIAARRDSAWYVLAKTLQRYRGRVAAAFAFFLYPDSPPRPLPSASCTRSRADCSLRSALRWNGWRPRRTSRRSTLTSPSMLSSIDPAIATASTSDSCA
ncbi:MAG: protein kinase [Planctomycetota bacterium]